MQPVLHEYDRLRSFIRLYHADELAAGGNAVLEIAMHMERAVRSAFSDHVSGFDKRPLQDD